MTRFWLPLLEQRRGQPRFHAKTLAQWQRLHEVHGILRVQVAECLAMDEAHRQEAGPYVSP